ncbi:MAG TPA: G1 family glutamic endopeptidase [Acidimicrobiales bacterium]|nr:G1 family glutamic endopeptidase [Acidimicrobiales bacterium]
MRVAVLRWARPPRAGVVVGACLLSVAAWAAAPAVAASTHAESARPAVHTWHGRPVVEVGANQSNNWSGYNQGNLETGKSGGFHSITGDWIVPTASPHKPMESEYSATWVGIGGGCLDTACSQTDNTLIQAGTEQDVNYDPIAGTSESYSAWYELIPNTSITVNLTVKPGDHIHVDIHENQINSENWSITIQDVSSGQSWSDTNISYQSTYATAEWIEETPVVVAVSVPPTVGFVPLPNLGTVTFDPGTVNGASPGLVPAEAQQLVDLTGSPEATASAPDSDTDGFNDCSYASSCTAPAS